jgi:hypothetical protein
MTIKFKCPFCDKPLSVKDELAGKKGPCPGCKKVVSIPTPGADTTNGQPTKPTTAKKSVNGVKPATKKSAAAPTKPLSPEEAEAAEAAAASLLSDEPPPPPEVANPQFIEFNCPACDEKVKMSAELAGKRGQCPECRNIVKVPELEKPKDPKDWRKVKTGPSAARENFEQEAPEGAWGSQAATGASRQALEDAGAVPPVREKLTVRQWIIRIGGPIAAVVVVGFVVWTIWSAIAETANEKAIGDALKQIEPADGKPKTPAPIVAEVRRAAGQYVLSLNKRNTAERALKLLGDARAALISSPDNASEKDLRLVDLAITQVDLAADLDAALVKADPKAEGDQVENGERLPRDKARGEIVGTLNAISSSKAKLFAVREVVRRLIKKNQSRLATGVAQASLTSPEELRVEAQAIVGLESFKSNPKASEVLATEALENYPPGGPTEGTPISPTVVALCRLVWPDNPASYSERLPQAAQGMQSKIVEVQLGAVEAIALKGDLAAARGMVNQIADPLSRAEALIIIAEIAAREKPESAQPDVEAALPLVKGKPMVGWSAIRLAHLAGECKQIEAAQHLPQTVSDLALKRQVQLVLLRGKLKSLGWAEDQETKAVDENSVAHLLAWEELAKHNARHGGALKTVAGWDEGPKKALGLVGAVLGGL